MSARWSALTAVVLLLGLTSCQEGPRPAASDLEIVAAETLIAAGPANLPLKELMRGLGTDMAAVVHGIWLEDWVAVEYAARSIAAHPRVTPDQMVAIQETLGEEFAAFVQQDQNVHGAAVKLAEAAAAAAPVSELFSGSVRIQEGCLSCHAQFRSRVAEALAATLDEP